MPSVFCQCCAVPSTLLAFKKGTQSNHNSHSVSMYREIIIIAILSTVGSVKLAVTFKTQTFFTITLVFLTSDVFYGLSVFHRSKLLLFFGLTFSYVGLYDVAHTHPFNMEMICCAAMEAALCLLPWVLRK